MTKTANEINPIMKKIHANTQIVREGIVAILRTLIFLYSVFLDMFYFFLILLMNKIYNYNLLIFIKQV
jgi:hypothetical protein